MYEVEEVNASNRLTEVYCKAWEGRYKRRPKIFTADISFVKRLVMDMGESEATRLIKHFFEMKDQYFYDRAHGFDLLRNNLNKVLASLGTEQSKRDSLPQGGLRMMWRIQCTTVCCGTYVEVSATLEELEAAMNTTRCGEHGGIASVPSQVKDAGIGQDA